MYKSYYKIIVYNAYGYEALPYKCLKLFKYRQMKNREPWNFCETPKEKCTMNYCDENGCQNRKRNYVQGNDLIADISVKVCVHCGKGREMHTVASAMCLDRFKHFEQTLR